MKQFPPSDDKAREGQFLPAGDGFGTLDDAHAPESMADALIGRKHKIDDLSPDWVIERLMRESTDYGTRTRQSARVAALKTLADILQLTESGLQKDDPLRRAIDLTPEERRRLIREKAREAFKRGIISPEDLKHG